MNCPHARPCRDRWCPGYDEREWAERPRSSPPASGSWAPLAAVYAVLSAAVFIVIAGCVVLLALFGPP